MSFTGKVAIVTGAASGIGAATVKALAREGAKVVLVDKNEENLKDVAKECNQYGNTPLMIRADITNDENVKMMVKETIDNFNQLDILINNAGIGTISTIFDENYMENFDRVMKTNLRSLVFLTHLAAPYLIKTKGNIVNTSSVCSLKSLKGKNLLAYSVSKAGVDHFTRSVALDLAPHGVRVNAVNPGPTKTNIIEDRETWKSCTAFKRLSEPEEVADLILFLASDKARSITGSTYVCDNGALLI
ncbi:3-oxoacyl-[acyl-carrier-protein] reductase FabG-like [Cydia pomonella]|uniref:3-oxoacyl-[acyl-carrier-protein] reductase FabG-like n=1 Tax=Cydia pomonella TaxID=82600 RepID=UPI002ADE84E5|nr:3-oxoacyl-[acyl-carrier-protein] reductase FabG-like [Cydia pomonella]